MKYQKPEIQCIDALQTLAVPDRRGGYRQAQTVGRISRTGLSAWVYWTEYDSVVAHRADSAVELVAGGHYQQKVVIALGKRANDATEFVETDYAAVFELIEGWQEFRRGLSDIVPSVGTVHREVYEEIRRYTRRRRPPGPVHYRLSEREANGFASHQATSMEVTDYDVRYYQPADRGYVGVRCIDGRWSYCVYDQVVTFLKPPGDQQCEVLVEGEGTEYDMCHTLSATLLLADWHMRALEAAGLPYNERDVGSPVSAFPTTYLQQLHNLGAIDIGVGSSLRGV